MSNDNIRRLQYQIESDMSNDNIRRLQYQIESEKKKKKISNCIHDYNEPFFNPDTIREAYGYNMVGHGSDVWYEPQGYRDVKVDRWTRVCKICGNSQHTNKLLVLVVVMTVSLVNF